MNDKKSFVDAIIESIGKQDLFKNAKTKVLDSGESLVFSEVNEIVYTLQTRFQLSDIGMAPSGIEYWIRFNAIEGLVEIVAKQNRLSYNFDLQYTIVSSIRNKELYRKITSGTLEVSVFKKSFEDFLSEEIVPFFNSRSTIKGLGEFVLQHGFSNIINIGIGGEYPLNVLKAIAIAKWCGNESRYEEYAKGLQSWIDEDRKDPKYAMKCDSYQGALNDLKEKLESRT